MESHSSRSAGRSCGGFGLVDIHHLSQPGKTTQQMLSPLRWSQGDALQWASQSSTHKVDSAVCTIVIWEYDIVV